MNITARNFNSQFNAHYIPYIITSGVKIHIILSFLDVRPIIERVIIFFLYYNCYLPNRNRSTLCNHVSCCSLWYSFPSWYGTMNTVKKRVTRFFYKMLLV